MKLKMSFFVTPKSKKRNYSVTFEDVSSNGKKIMTQDRGDIPQTKSLKSKNGGKIRNRKKLEIDQEEKSSSEDDIGPGGIDDMDFDKDSEKEESDENEDNRETPTEKRRRLAKQYIESVKERLSKHLVM